MTPRAVKSRHMAIERLEPFLPSVTVEKKGRGYIIRVHGSRLPDAHKSTKETLAFLADLAKHRGLDQEKLMREVAWVGTIPTRGLAAWQEYALEWLQGGASNA